MARLLEALQRASASGPSPAYVRSLVDGFAGVSNTRDSAILSPRELDVVRLMARGASNSHIADELVVSVATVKTHVNGVFRKLGAANRVEALIRARERGLI
jgi:DNA-binding NarL/FixJ family response regulator